MMEEKMTEMTLAEEIATVAAGRVHNLAAYQVDGQHEPTPAQYRGIMAYLLLRPERPTEEQQMTRPTGAERYFEERTAASPAYRQALADARKSCQSDHVSDIAAGFYATPSRTGNNDFDFWKVTEGRKPGVRFAKRVIGGGDTKYPRLVEVSQGEQRAALGAILRAGIQKAADDYADNQERCKKCGIHLTDDESRAARMGPVCRGDR
jgi:Family of unknown function (DUF6011)